MNRSHALTAVSPLDGRYASYTEPLSPFASESGLMRARVQVEVEYLIALASIAATPSIPADDRAALTDLYESFDEEDAQLIKRIETEGYGDQPATNHDVKAVEYFIRDSFPEYGPWIHFGLTSEDVNNLAQRLLLRDALNEVLVPDLCVVRDSLGAMARKYRDLGMLARTHGQPATPTTFGKEMAVYASRLDRVIERIRDIELGGKLAGASGTYAAHVASYPEVDWRDFSRAFVESLGLTHVPLVTQINPCDDIAALFDAFRRANSVLIDMARDMWLYISDRYLGQQQDASATGSSTMPHKVNPIDFENCEGNLSKANSDLGFLADYITTSRLQRDLSDSTVKRTIGSTLAHCHLGYRKLENGLETVVPNEQVMRDELAANPEVISEAIQTILRREGHPDAYERVKDLTRGQRVTIEMFRELIDELDLSDEVSEELKALTPAGYTGLANELVDELPE